MSASLPAPIIIFNGTSSAGKSSIIRELQNLFPQPFLEAGLDRFLWMLPPRYLKPPLWDEILGHADHAGPIGHRLISGMHHAIGALSRTGNSVMAEHVLLHRAWVQECAAIFHQLPAYLIAVHCSLTILEQRERERGDRTLGQARAQFPLVHAHTRYDFEVDTAACSPTPHAFTALHHHFSQI